MHEEVRETQTDRSTSRDASEIGGFAELFEAVTGTTEVTEPQEEERSHDPVITDNQAVIDIDDGLEDAVGTPETE